MSIKPLLELIDWLLGKRKKKAEPVPIVPPVKRYPNILVIEDSANDRDLLLLALEAIGLTAAVAHNAEEAQGLLRKNGYDFVFLDMRLTYKPGWEMVHFIWEHCLTCHIILMPGQIEDIAKIRQPKKAFTVMPKSAIRVQSLRELMVRFNVQTK